MPDSSPLNLLQRMLAALVPMAALLSGTAALAQVQDCEVNGRAINLASGQSTAGVTGLMRCVDRRSGEIRREQALQDGRFIGLVRFYEKGKRVSEHHVNERGNKEGTARTWTGTGTLLSRETFRNGATLGPQVFFHENGELRRLSIFELRSDVPADSSFLNTEEIASAEWGQDGKLANLRCARRPVMRIEGFDDTRLCGFGGESRVNLYARGIQGEVRTFRDGQIIERLILNPDGQTRSTWVLKEGRITERQFSNAGKLVKEFVSVQAERGSIREIERDYHDSGQLVLERRWLRGQLSAEWRWYLNGQPSQQIDYNGNASARREYFDNGQLSAEGRFINDRLGRRPVGEHKSWDEAGRLRLQLSHDEQGRLERDRRWDEKGQPTRDEQVFEDGSRKAYAR